MKIVFVLLITAVSLCGQSPKLNGTVPPSKTPMELSAENKEKIRLLQLEWDEIEIANQKSLLQVEQNKAQQLRITESIRSVAYEHAVANNIDLKVFEIDSRLLKFIPAKKKP